MKKTILIKMIGVLLLMGILSGCSLLNFINPLGEKGHNGKGKWAKDNKSAVVGFNYYYDGTIGANNNSIVVKKNEDGKFILTYSSMEYADNNIFECEIDDTIMKSIYDIYIKYHAEKWNGYAKYATNVSDGDGFSFSINFEDGHDYKVSGMNCSPDGFYDFSHEVLSLFTEYIDELTKDAKKIWEE